MNGRQRRGFVLVAALVMLIIIALLITGAFFASGQDFAISRAELRDQQVFSYAEYAAAHAIESWDAGSRALMSVGQTQTVQTMNDPPLEGTVLVTRLDTLAYAITAEARITAVDGTRIVRRVGITLLSAVHPMRAPEQAWSELY